MAYARYTGAWARISAGNPPTVRLVAPINPAHEDKTANLGPVEWEDTTRAPGLPGNSLGADTMQIPTPGGPVDKTPPGYGVGMAPGLGVEAAQATRVRVQGENFGAAAARLRHPVVDRQGVDIELEYRDNRPGDGDSPEQKVFRETGVGSPLDPGARLSRRIKRFWHQTWDLHRWGVEQRPRYNKGVMGAPVQAGIGGDVSPYDTLQYMGAPDRFVRPQLRRIPRPWDEGSETDGTDAAQPVNFGLTTWGL